MAARLLFSSANAKLINNFHSANITAQYVPKLPQISPVSAHDIGHIAMQYGRNQRAIWPMWHGEEGGVENYVDNPLKSVWINTALLTRHYQRAFRPWISTALCEENKQVFHGLVVKKHINLLNLQQISRIVDKLRYALTVSQKILSALVQNARHCVNIAKAKFKGQYLSTFPRHIIPIIFFLKKKKREYNYDLALKRVKGKRLKPLYNRTTV